jgi:hypothetical protein
MAIGVASAGHQVAGRQRIKAAGVEQVEKLCSGDCLTAGFICNPHPHSPLQCPAREIARENDESEQKSKDICSGNAGRRLPVDGFSRLGINTITTRGEGSSATLPAAGGDVKTLLWDRSQSLRSAKRPSTLHFWGLVRPETLSTFSKR